MTIFGFGSLMSTFSLMATAPTASDIQPAYIKGFIRCFNFWDSVGYTETNLDVADEPMCALDIAKVENIETRVNGVAFVVNESDLSNLLKREDGYQLITVPVYDYETDHLITDDCLVFSANKNDGLYVFESKAQRRYLEDYLSAAEHYGDRFYQEVLDTTFIGDQPLRRVARLADIL